MFLLVPAHLGRPRQRAVKRLCVCVCVCVCFWLAEPDSEAHAYQCVIVLEDAEVDNVVIDVSNNASHPVVISQSHSAVSSAGFKV